MASLEETEAYGEGKGVACECRDSSAVANEVKELARDSARGGRVEGREIFLAIGVARAEDGVDSVVGNSTGRPGGEARSGLGSEVFSVADAASGEGDTLASASGVVVITGDSIAVSPTEVTSVA